MTQLMKDMNFLEMQKKFINPDVTANGDQRASVPLMKPPPFGLILVRYATSSVSIVT